MLRASEICQIKISLCCICSMCPLYSPSCVLQTRNRAASCHRFPRFWSQVCLGDTFCIPGYSLSPASGAGFPRVIEEQSLCFPRAAWAHTAPKARRGKAGGKRRLCVRFVCNPCEERRPQLRRKRTRNITSVPLKGRRSACRKSTVHPSKSRSAGRTRKFDFPHFPHYKGKPK